MQESIWYHSLHAEHIIQSDPDVIGILHVHYMEGSWPSLSSEMYVLFFGLETLSGSHFKCTAVNVPALHFGERNIGLTDVRK